MYMEGYTVVQERSGICMIVDCFRTALIADNVKFVGVRRGSHWRPKLTSVQCLKHDDSLVDSNDLHIIRSTLHNFKICISVIC